MYVCMYVRVSPFLRSFPFSSLAGWRSREEAERPREAQRKGPERPREAQRGPERPTQDLGGPVALDEAAAVMYTSLRVS